MEFKDYLEDQDAIEERDSEYVATFCGEGDEEPVHERNKSGVDPAADDILATSWAALNTADEVQELPSFGKASFSPKQNQTYSPPKKSDPAESEQSSQFAALAEQKSSTANNEISEKRIRRLRVEHGRSMKQLEEEFTQINVAGKMRDFDPAPGNEKIFTLAKRAPPQASPVAAVGSADPTSFLDDETNKQANELAKIAAANSCWICGEAGKDKSKQKECEFCGISCCQACVQAARRFPRQLVIKGAGDEPARAPCCKVCVGKLFMGEFYLGMVEDAPQQDSLRDRIAKREAVLSGRHGDLRQRQRELVTIMQGNQELSQQLVHNEEKYSDKEEKIEQEIGEKHLMLVEVRGQIKEKEIQKNDMQRKLDTLRDVEAAFFERNAELDREIDDRKRTNERLGNEFECLTEAIKRELEKAKEAADRENEPSPLAQTPLDSILDSIATAPSPDKKPDEPQYQPVPDFQVDTKSDHSSKVESMLSPIPEQRPEDEKESNFIESTNTPPSGFTKYDQASASFDNALMEMSPQGKRRLRAKKQISRSDSRKSSMAAAQSGACCAGGATGCLMF